MTIDDIRKFCHEVYGDREDAKALVPKIKELFITHGFAGDYDLNTIIVVDRGQGWWGVTFPKEKSDENH